MAEPAVHVEYLDHEKLAIQVRQHHLVVDQPVDSEGDDTAPTPTELLVASLASCVGFYAHRYLTRHHLSSDGLAVDADFAIGERPTRVGQITVRITPPPSLPAEQRQAFLAVASHCTVHNTLHTPPAVTIGMADIVET
ncbi:MAG TPA: OsmC family protein [Mycobacteriales bacterium]|jgi:Predicted redox protein, regulator of disulfide bond formation